MMTPNEKLQAVAAAYLRRQARCERPDGTFDRASRWEPSEDEARPCCSAIRTPSRAYPFSKMLHCRSAAHLAQLYDVSLVDLRRAIKAAKLSQKLA